MCDYLFDRLWGNVYEKFDIYLEDDKWVELTADEVEKLLLHYGISNWENIKRTVNKFVARIEGSIVSGPVYHIWITVYPIAAKFNLVRHYVELFVDFVVDWDEIDEANNFLEEIFHKSTASILESNTHLQVHKRLQEVLARYPIRKRYVAEHSGTVICHSIDCLMLDVEAVLFTPFVSKIKERKPTASSGGLVSELFPIEPTQQNLSELLLDKLFVVDNVPLLDDYEFLWFYFRGESKEKYRKKRVTGITVDLIVGPRTINYAWSLTRYLFVDIDAVVRACERFTEIATNSLDGRKLRKQIRKIRSEIANWSVFELVKLSKHL